MNGAVKLNLINFLLVYLLLILVLLIMKKSKIHQTKLLFLSSIRMTLQLVLAGLVLTYFFKKPHPLFTIIYIISMIVFSVLSTNKNINKKFKFIVAASLSFTGVFVLLFFMICVINQSIFNPQYAIPISGMLIGNSLTGVLLGLKTFNGSIQTGKNKIDALLNLGVTPQKILLPYVNSALETALLPTLNSMLGMGIISLPGMMTGQILSGTLPTTAIMYQIAIVVAICASVCISTFLCLNFGYKTLYNNASQINIKLDA